MSTVTTVGFGIRTFPPRLALGSFDMRLYDLICIPVSLLKPEVLRDKILETSSQQPFFFLSSRLTFQNDHLVVINPSMEFPNMDRGPPLDLKAQIFAPE